MAICNVCNTDVTRYYQTQWLCRGGHWAALPGHSSQYDAMRALEAERDTLSIHKWRLVEVTEIITIVDSGNNGGLKNKSVLCGDG